MIRQNNVKLCEMNRSRPFDSTWRVRNWGVVWWRDPLVKMEALRRSYEAIKLVLKYQQSADFESSCCKLNADPALQRWEKHKISILKSEMVTYVTICQLCFEVYHTLIRCPRPSDAEQDIGKMWHDMNALWKRMKSRTLFILHTTPYISVLFSSKLSKYLETNFEACSHCASLPWISCCGQQSSAFPVIGSGIVRSWRDSGGARSCPSGLDIAFLCISDIVLT